MLFRSVAAALGFATLPLASFYGVAASTDALLLLCWTAAMYSLWLALQGHAWGWVGLGLSAGLGLLAKYSMAVLGPSVVLVLLHRPWRVHWHPARAPIGWPPGSDRSTIGPRPDRRSGIHGIPPDHRACPCPKR